jgi:hypothetical protein
MKIVEVHWLDAHGGSRSGWRPLKDVASTEPVLAKTVGYLVTLSRKMVVVCPHVIESDGGTDGDGEIAIPRSWVKKIRSLSGG